MCRCLTYNAAVDEHYDAVRLDWAARDARRGAGSIYCVFEVVYLSNIIPATQS